MEKIKITPCEQGLYITYNGNIYDAFYILEGDNIAVGGLKSWYERGGKANIYIGIQKMNLIKNGVRPVPDGTIEYGPYWTNPVDSVWDRLVPNHPKRYIVEGMWFNATSFQDACLQASKRGIKIHKSSKFEDLKVVFYESEDYWQPANLKIYRREDGKFNIVFQNRRLEVHVVEDVCLQKAFRRAKSFCKSSKIKWDIELFSL